MIDDPAYRHHDVRMLADEIAGEMREFMVKRIEESGYKLDRDTLPMMTMIVAQLIGIVVAISPPGEPRAASRRLIEYTLDIAEKLPPPA
jgi:hypothetical protein